MADPIDSDTARSSLGVLEDQSPDHDHGPHEDGEFSPDRLVIEQDELVADLDAPEPLAVEGLVPDLEDMPQEWLQETPAGPAPVSTQALPSTDAAVPAPPTRSLPRTLDAAPGWQATMACDPNDKPGMIAFADLVSAHYDRPRYTTSRRCLSGSTSQHHEGRAMDWPMNVYNAQDKAIGDAVAAWITADNGAVARRFGIMSVIWNKKSWYLWNPGVWNTYTGPSPHTDHLHISFTWDGAMKRTSWWTGTPVTQVDHGTCRVYSLQYAPRYTARRTSPCPTSLPQAPRTDRPVVLPGATNSHVSAAQGYLGFTGSAVDGSFGPMTLAALLTYQRQQGLPVTGVLDNATWHRMASVGVPSAPGIDVTRTSGGDRYGTAANLSKASSTGGTVFVTTGEDYPDALAASAWAGSLKRPVLLTRSDGLPGATVTALERLRPSRIVMIGGEKSLTRKVRTQIATYAGSGGTTWLRGADRYSTAAQVARQFGTNLPVVYVATGENYPDAVAAATRAGISGAPVLLVRHDGVPGATASAMRDLRPRRVVVVGGTTSVQDKVAESLRLATRDRSMTRLGGPDRYATASKVAMSTSGAQTSAFVSTGLNYPDALTAGAQAAAAGAPMLLTKTTELPGRTTTALRSLEPRRVSVVGGTDVVSTGVAEALRRVLD